MRQRFWLLLLLLGWPSLTWGQTDPCGTVPTGTVHNPTRLCWQNPDHATATGYAVEYWLQGVDPSTGTPVQSFSVPLGAIEARPNGAGWTSLLSSLQPLPAVPQGQTYVARMTVTYPTGTSPRSVETNPFDFPSALTPAAAVSVQ